MYTKILYINNKCIVINVYIYIYAYKFNKKILSKALNLVHIA